MDLKLTGKIALITGASRGIGRAIAQTLAAEGCDLLLVAKSADTLAATAGVLRQASDRRIETLAIDLRSPEAPATVAAALAKDFGRLDILVNNAGATKAGDFLKLGDEDWQDGFALKFFGHVRLTRAVWPALVDARGVVVNVIGAAAKTPAPTFMIGGAVNAAFTNFTGALAQRGIAEGVRVVAVHPGPVKTDRLEQLLTQQAEAQGIPRAELERNNLKSIGVARYGESEDVAQLVAFLASPNADHIKGAQILVDGGQTRSL